jgi:anti-sigma-K factor RskA
LSADRAITLTLPPALAALAKDNAVLAVSLEPPGGSPTGAPTGPVIASGKLTNL